MLSDIIVKIMVVGDPKVGKTQLANLYARRVVHPNPLPTAGFDFYTTKLKVETGQEVKVQMLDTSGDPKFRSVIIPHMNLACGCLLVYSVADRSSFENVQLWIETFKEKASKSAEPIMILVGNQMDREDRKVTIEEGRNLAIKNGILFVETSYENQDAVDEAFNLLIADTYYSMKLAMKSDGNKRLSIGKAQLKPEENTSQSINMGSLMGGGNIADLVGGLALGKPEKAKANAGFFGGAFDWLADEDESDEWEFEDEDENWLVPEDGEEELEIPPTLQPRTVYRSESGKLRRLKSRKSSLRRDATRNASLKSTASVGSRKGTLADARNRTPDRVYEDSAAKAE